MNFKTILVQIENSTRCAACIDLAAQLASDFEAHLIGLYVSYIAEMQNYPFEGGLEPIANQILREAENDNKKAAELFQDRIHQARLASTEWRHAEGFIENAMKLHARFAD